MARLTKSQRHLHHTSASSVDIAEGFPHVKDGNEGDITLRHIRGKGVYMFIKFRNRWYSRQFLSGQGRNVGVKESGLENPTSGQQLNFHDPQSGRTLPVDVSEVFTVDFGSPGKLRLGSKNAPGLSVTPAKGTLVLGVDDSSDFPGQIYLGDGGSGLGGIIAGTQNLASIQSGYLGIRVFSAANTKHLSLLTTTASLLYLANHDGGTGGHIGFKGTDDDPAAVTDYGIIYVDSDSDEFYYRNNSFSPLKLGVSQSAGTRVNLSLQDITTDLIPNADEGVNLGKASNKFHTLYCEAVRADSGSIFIGDIKMSVTGVGSAAKLDIKAATSEGGSSYSASDLTITPQVIQSAGALRLEAATNIAIRPDYNGNSDNSLVRFQYSPDAGTSYIDALVIEEKGNIIPGRTKTINLGSRTKKFNTVFAKDMRLDKGTLYVGDIKLTTEGTGTNAKLVMEKAATEGGSTYSATDNTITPQIVQSSGALRLEAATNIAIRPDYNGNDDDHSSDNVYFQNTTDGTNYNTKFAVDYKGGIKTTDATNNGSPVWQLGASDAECLHIQTVYDSGAQTLDYVQFTSKTDDDGTAHAGTIRFAPDAGNRVDINDTGIDVQGGTISNTTGALNVNASSSVAVNIDKDNSGTASTFTVKSNLDSGSPSTCLSITETGDTTILGDLTVNGNDIAFDAAASTISVAASAHDAAGTNLNISAGDTTAGTSDNQAGGSLVLEGGQGKGSGAGGSIFFKTANEGSSGDSLNALANALVISDDLSASFTGKISTRTATAPQLALEYDASNYATFTTGSDGDLTIATLDNGIGTAGNITLDADGAVILDPTNGITKFYKAGDTDDLCTLTVAANGVTTIATADSDGVNAHLTLDADGDVIIDADGGNITLQDGGSTYTPSAASDATTKTYVDSNIFSTKAWSTTLIKILPTDFMVDDNYSGRAANMIEDDQTDDLSYRVGSALTNAYAIIDIPNGYEATAVVVYASANTANATEIFPLDITDGTLGTRIGQDDFNTNISLSSALVGTTDNALVVKILPAANNVYIYGGKVTIAAT